MLETLAPVPRDRKCFRLINGVLVERTVSDVVPALQTNADGLKTVLEGLVKEYRKKQEEMDTWKVSRCHVVRRHVFVALVPGLVPVPQRLAFETVC